MATSSSTTVDRTVAVFWDIENMPVPREMDAALLGNALQDLARSLSSSQNLEFVNAYIDTGRLGTANANKLSQVGISLIHSPVAKEAADKAIILDLLLWLLIFERHRAGAQGGPEPCVVLVSQDHDFLPLCSKLRNQRGIHVALVTDYRTAQPHFLNAANESFDWAEVLQDAERFARNSPAGRARANTADQSARLDAPAETPAQAGRAAVRREESQESASSASSAKSLMKRFSSLRVAEDSIEDQISDFCLQALVTKNKATADVLLGLMKNPALGGGADMAQVAGRDYGKYLDSILARHPDRFELSTNRRSQKTWVELRPGQHKPLCRRGATRGETGAPAGPPSPPAAVKAEAEAPPAQLQRKPSDWAAVLRRSTGGDAEE